ncbi:MAG: acyl-CoA thioesterase [Planctomycetes bacterium]|nr:acyl-CoA thioesterase [Planctomycetota bacterium]
MGGRHRLNHRTILRVRYGETDKAGVAWHGSYVAWYEVGRCEFLRDVGINYASFEHEQQLFLTVVGMDMRFLKPARSDDVLVVETAVAAVERASVRFEQHIFHQGAEQCASRASVRVACVDASGRVAALPSVLREALLRVLVARKSLPAPGVDTDGHSAQ